VSVEQTSLSLNLAFAKAGLKVARKAIKDEDLTGADRALSVVQRSTVFEVNVVDIPLLTARENLYLAKTRVADGNVDGALNALDTASDALDLYGKNATPSRAEEVAALRGEISQLSTDLQDDGSSQLASADVEDKVLSYWDRVVQWWEE
jgi:hypothetical protein